MNISGWIFMFISWAVIIGLFIFCMVRTLRRGSGNKSDKQPPLPKS